MIESLDEPKGQQTEFLLKAISTRLSSRDDCKGKPYTVKIDHNGVSMTPLVYVFPSRYKRKEGDQMDIVSFVHKYKMSSALLSDFVFGTYRYEQIGDSIKRKWRKVE